LYHQRVGTGARAQLWLGEGRLHAVDSVLATGELSALRRVINAYFIATYLASVGDSALAASAAEVLAGYVTPETVRPLVESGEQAWREAWALASYQASVGDTVVARRWERAIAALPQGDTPWDWAASLAADTESRIAVRRGDLATAEAEARRAYNGWMIHSNNAGDTHPEYGMRFHLAEVLRAAGKLDEAASLYRSFGPPHNWTGFYTARSSYELGVMAEQAGDYAEAATRYQQALLLWERGDETVSAWRRRAQEGLQRALDRVG
jgi:tetratricopeptide (TPR) repeat protein